MAAARGTRLVLSSHPSSRLYLGGALLATAAAGAGLVGAIAYALSGSGDATGAAGPHGAIGGAALEPDQWLQRLILCGAAAPIGFWAVRLVGARRSLPGFVLALFAVPAATLALTGFAAAGFPAGTVLYGLAVAALAALAWVRRPFSVEVLDSGLRLRHRTVLWRDLRGYSTLAVDHYWGGFRAGTLYHAAVRLDDGTIWVVAPGVERAAALCETLEGTLGNRLWRDAMQRLAHGEPASFGAFDLEPDGVRVGRRVLSWVEVRGAALDRRTFTINARGQTRPWARLKRETVTAPNVAWRIIDARLASSTLFADALAGAPAVAAPEADAEAAPPLPAPGRAGAGAAAAAPPPASPPSLPSLPANALTTMAETPASSDGATSPDAASSLTRTPTP
ncbi:MAG TPA: hypothetical protein VG389_23215 [Myxococcota bacterium]|jgi:hypothetical protein|nr:hypothetical protein [Myxococcota bacterium]